MGDLWRLSYRDRGGTAAIVSVVVPWSWRAVCQGLEFGGLGRGGLFACLQEIRPESRPSYGLERWATFLLAGVQRPEVLDEREQLS